MGEVTVNREHSPVSWKASNDPAERGDSGAAHALMDYPSAAWRQMMAWIELVAPTELPVLLLGESGSGKEHVARALHALAPWAPGPFVALNCAALPESLIEGELFGAARGAYTGSERDRPGLFREAHGGTLFLDEVGEMPAAMQAKLLRVLERGTVRPLGGGGESAVDVRVVAATHIDLATRVAQGAFRADLYWRLAVVPVEIPALRLRLEDLGPLVAALLPRIARETGRGPLAVGADVWPELRAYAWPGNVRELHAVLARAALRAAGREIAAEHLDLPPAVPGREPEDDERLERRMIEAALDWARGSVTQAATRIGWTRQKLYRRMEALGLPRELQGRCSTSSESSTFQ